MKHTIWFGLLLLASGQAASAQPADNLTDQQKLGRQVFAQSCGVCHLPPSLGAKTYGPPLNKDAGGGDNDVMREFVENGTPRMPGFKYHFKPAEIDAIVAYIKTIPAPSDAPPPAKVGSPRDAD